MLNIFSRYTTDVISSCAFGLEADSLHNPNSEFRIKGKAVFTPTPRQRLREVLFSLSPGFVRFLRFTLFPQHVTDFFINLVSDTIKYRNKNGIVRNDFLNLLMNVQKEEEESKHFSKLSVSHQHVAIKNLKRALLWDFHSSTDCFKLSSCVTILF